MDTGAVSDVFKTLGLKKLTFAMQNCNSLNLTGLTKNLYEKVTAITSIKSDIIFLSDTRLTNASGVQNTERVSTLFRDNKNKSYSCFFNSSKNSRGVGILIANEIPITVINRIDDVDENFLVISAKINNFRIILASVYGPNGINREFFTKLEEAIRQSGVDDSEIVIGGDWNTCWDNSPVHLNVDTFEMANVPNLANSQSLHNLCTNLKLTDPFRILYPDKKDYSYQPFGTVRLNRSRLDFFCISEKLIPEINDVTISSATLTSLFDHKSVMLSFGNDAQKKINQNLSNIFLKDKIFKFGITTCALRVHLAALDENSEQFRTNSELINREKNTVSNMWTLVKNFFAESMINAQTPNPNSELQCAGFLTQLDLLQENSVGTDFLVNLPRRVTDSEFFVAERHAVNHLSHWFITHALEWDFIDIDSF